MAGPAETESLTIRPLDRADRAEWGRLWQGYLKFYKTELPQAQYDLTFERMLSGEPGEFQGFLALLGDRPVGLVHYLFHRHGWKAEPVCYLQDLYADPEVRGRGIGAALITAVYAAADDAGAPTVYWMTQEDNAQARKLYDQIAGVTDFIKYQRPS
ncbi:GNAT family N-acetyltransferase [Pseudooceanicola nitratireducens]|uniref:GNAT family N-acetyltransferase n=1 Tax=Pseudooceanicola nitratireducens TaxID=517719 RepID=UPI001C95BA53|nr:GNAT family N-acetyltransferase [Pseudooceanicola nitratireducens]MBY6157117.1 GNAT family N-acetyltransferase [Pseudooceanicola nitratireducens]MBY6166070.1 GNAT family N-acetyltransferase [Pseudooceanicola nitratireducens]MEC7793814.1 GNAT family N-acetyltransferase [Pseudomonadota bacterium]